MKNVFVICLITLFVACKTYNNVNTNLRIKDPNVEYNTCVLIEKKFVNKGGKISEYKEFYLQCSIQDYFIKICESNITLDELKPYLNSGIKVKMEIKEGMWDHCNDDPAFAQSRIGPYAVIKEIIN